MVGAGVALALLFACGGKIGTTTNGVGPSPTTTTTSIPKPPRPPPTPTDTDDFPPPDPPGGQCPTTDPITSADLPYETAAAPKIGACTEEELQALVAAVPNAMSDDDLKKAVSKQCASCIFTDVNNPPWGPLPEVDSGGGAQAVTINQGGCYQLVTGSASCGKAIQNALDCSFYACADCADNNAYYKCEQAAPKTACKAMTAAEQSACGALDPAVLQKGDEKCGAGTGSGYGFEGAVRVMCITGP